MGKFIKIVYKIKEEKVIQSIIEGINEVYGFFKIRPIFYDFDINFAYNKIRKQYDAFKILNKYENLIEKENDFVLLIVKDDIYVAPLNFCFGLALGNISIISTARLTQTFYNTEENYEIYYARCKKEAIHEIGHMLGLNHCNNSYCVMYFSNSIIDTDRKSHKLCTKCSDKIKRLFSK